MLFKKHKPAPVAEFGYQDAIDYLRDLEQVDYAKILKVVKTYREADKKVKKILNIKDEPIEELDVADMLIDDDNLGIETSKPKKATKNASR